MCDNRCLPHTPAVYHAPLVFFMADETLGATARVHVRLTFHCRFDTRRARHSQAHHNVRPRRHSRPRHEPHARPRGLERQADVAGVQQHAACVEVRVLSCLLIKCATISHRASDKRMQIYAYITGVEKHNVAKCPDMRRQFARKNSIFLCRPTTLRLFVKTGNTEALVDIR